MSRILILMMTFLWIAPTLLPIQKAHADSLGDYKKKKHDKRKKIK
jgi:hypothetical protein